MFLQHAKMETAQHAADGVAASVQIQQDVKENWYGHARPTEDNG